MDIEVRKIEMGETVLVFAIREGKASLSLVPKGTEDKINVEKLPAK